MRRAVLLIMFLFGITAIFSQNNTEISGVYVIRNSPTNYSQVEGKTIVHSIRSTQSVFYAGDYIVYKLTATINFQTNKDIPETEPYFIRKKNEAFGYRFENIHDSSMGTPLSADSFIASLGLGSGNLDVPKESDGFSVSGMVNDPSGNGTVEKFGIKQPENEAVPDTLFYHYRKDFPKIDLTFSRQLDSLRGMKLYKIRMYYKEKFSKQTNSVMPEHEMLLELKPIENGIPAEVLKLLDRFKRRTSNNKPPLN